MTLSTTANTQSYTGDGSTTAFAFPYLFYADSDLKVYQNGTLKTISTHYTVTGAESPSGGTVTFVTAPASDDAIVIQRVVSLNQETDLENFDGNPADVTEKQFDLLAMMSQQIDENVDRAILAPIGTSLTSNAISGTIDSTTRVLTLTTSGPATATIASLGTALDVLLSGEASGDLLRYDGTNWVNVTEISTTNIADASITLDKLGSDITAAGKALLDDANAAAQRTTLGLGTAATTAASAYATAAQGTKADTALQPSTQTIIQTVQASDATMTSGTAQIPLDDTIPQNTEGLEAITLAITPTDASNKLRIRGIVNIASTTTNAELIIALFQDSTANAIAVSSMHCSNQDRIMSISIDYEMVAGTTSSTTFKIRGGSSSSVTVTLNGTAGARKFGGVLAHNLTIEEIKV